VSDQPRKLANLSAAVGALLGVARADVLPDDRADVLWHGYNGGGISVEGWSTLATVKFGDHVSVAGNYYTDNIVGHVDTIAGASVNAVSGASRYQEKRTQRSVSGNLLADKTTYSLGFIDSNEPDFKSKTAFGSVSESMFGDLTTVSFGFTRGWDKVGERGAPEFSKDADRRNWQLGVSQVLTRNLLLGLNFETTESEGYLNNPYRLVRYVDPTAARGYSTQPEQYPHTRTGNAASGQLKFHLPGRGAVDGGYRFYSDTWGIRASTVNVGYTQPLFASLTIDGHVRFYRQNQANFYSDLFPYASAQNFLARDRELAAFKSTSPGVGISWEFHPARFSWIQKGSLNGRFDHLSIHYRDYRDLTDVGVTPGTEPLYVLSANVLQFFISVWF